MNKYPLALLLLAGSSYAHETGYKHFHEEAASTEQTEPAFVTSAPQTYNRKPAPLYMNFGLHRVQKFKLDNSNTDFTKPTGLSANIGYQVHPNFSIEAGAVSFGEANTFSSNGSTNSATDTLVHGATLGGRLSHSFENKIHASVSAGLMFWRVETDIVQTFNSFPGKFSVGSFSENASDPYWSAGLGFEVSPNAIIKLNYNKYMQKDIFKNSINNVDLEQSSLSLSVEIIPGKF